jgi:hypothetical protein
MPTINVGSTWQKEIYDPNEIKYRKALVFIAKHFEFCDLDDDRSAWYVVRTAAEALGWTIVKDQYNQVEFKKD